MVSAAPLAGNVAGGLGMLRDSDRGGCLGFCPRASLLRHLLSPRDVGHRRMDRVAQTGLEPGIGIGIGIEIASLADSQQTLMRAWMGVLRPS
ncbi:hypothetical protein CKO23_03840 [Thiocystis violacea]|nr:hypothetical protein [Thiocystis violacea]